MEIKLKDSIAKGAFGRFVKLAQVILDESGENPVAIGVTMRTQAQADDRHYIAPAVRLVMSPADALAFGEALTVAAHGMMNQCIGCMQFYVEGPTDGGYCPTCAAKPIVLCDDCGEYHRTATEREACFQRRGI